MLSEVDGEEEERERGREEEEESIKEDIGDDRSKAE